MFLEISVFVVGVCGILKVFFSPLWFFVVGVSIVGVCMVFWKRSFHLFSSLQVVSLEAGISVVGVCMVFWKCFSHLFSSL